MKDANDKRVKVEEILRSGLFTTKALSRGAGVCKKTIREARNGSSFLHPHTVDKIVKFLNQVRNQLLP